MHCWRNPCPAQLCELPTTDRQPGSANPEAECKAAGANATSLDSRPQGLPVLAETQPDHRKLRYQPIRAVPYRERATAACPPTEHVSSTSLPGALLNCAK